MIKYLMDDCRLCMLGQCCIHALFGYLMKEGGGGKKREIYRVI